MSNSDTSNITVSNISINSESAIINHDSIKSNIVINKKTVTFNDNIQEIKINNSNEDIESNTNDEDNNIFKCYYCNKIFKTKNTYLNHKRMQVCYDTKDKTYCSVCDITFNSKAELDDHLLSEDHYNCINNLTVIPITKRTRDINRLDPILNNQDIKKINTVDIGSNIIFVYNNDEVEKQKITVSNPLLNNINSNSSLNSNNDIIKEDVSINNNSNNDNAKNNNNIERQNKIITFLINNAEETDNTKKFLQLLNKLNLEDYNGLNNAIIKNSDIPVLAKQQYIKTIQTFIKLLIKKKNKGETLHNNNNIQDIVTAISS